MVGALVKIHEDVEGDLLGFIIYNYHLFLGDTMLYKHIALSKDTSEMQNRQSINWIALYFQKCNSGL